MGHTKAVDVLLDNGADPNRADANGYTSLHRVVRDSDYGINLASRDVVLTVVKSLLSKYRVQGHYAEVVPGPTGDPIIVIVRPEIADVVGDATRKAILPATDIPENERRGA